MAWTESRVATLRKGWAEGLSASQIAKQLGGTTRNAVIGKVHRIGLQGRAQPSRPARRPVRTRRAPAQPGELQPIDTKLGIHGLTNFTCRYPIGDPMDADFAFCGRTCNNVENPYCTQHQRLAFQPSQAKKRKHDETARLANWIDRRSFKVAA